MSDDENWEAIELPPPLASVYTMLRPSEETQHYVEATTT